jgi:endo-1,3(4)-beta-glucanase
LKAFSVKVNLLPRVGSPGKITFPLLQGMGFVTGRYSHLQPAIQSSVFFRVLTPRGSPKPGVFKYQVTLEDNKTWLLYVTPDNGADPNLQRISNALIRGPAGFTGTIQVAKNSSGAPGEHMYDAAAGSYPTDATITGSVTGTSGQYTFQWTKSGLGSSALVMFALPHHVASFDSSTASHITAVQLATTTKGNSTAVVGNSWTILEPNIPTAVGFAPWAPGTVFPLSAAAKAKIRDVAASDVSANFDADIYKDGNGMYFGGKRICKFARIVYTIHDLLADPALAAGGLAKLKNSFARVVRNQQPAPLAYDDVWRGIVSSAGYRDMWADFGNTAYNDHHL